MTSTRDMRLVFPLSPAQAGIWSDYEAAKRLPVYNMYAAVRLRGDLDVTALRTSLQDVISRHDTLRTSIALCDGRPSQWVQRDANVELPFIDLSDRAERLREQLLMQRIEAEARHEFDLQQDPLFRCELVRLGHDDHVLISNLHHVIADGWSNMVLVRDVAKTYDARVRGRSAALPPLGIQYGDYCERQHARPCDIDACRSLDFWEERLRDLDPLLPLSARSQRPSVKTYEALTQSRDLPATLVEQLKVVAQHHRCSLFMVLLAAFKVLASRYAARTDIAVATPTANRGEPELADLIGLFANSLVLRTDLAQAATFEDVLRRVKQSCAEAFRYQQVLFQDVVDAVKPAREANQMPFTQLFFVLHNVPSEAPAMGELRLEALALPRRFSAYDLQVELFREGAGLRLDLTHNRELYGATFASQLADHYVGVLHRIADDPAIAWSTMTLDEPAVVIEDQDGSTAATGDDRFRTTLPGIFEAAWRLAGPEPALVTATQTITYAELRRRAVDLVQAVSSLAMPPGVLTIVADDTFDLAVAVLAGLERGDHCRFVTSADVSKADFAASNLLIARSESVMLELDPHRGAQSMGHGWWALRGLGNGRASANDSALVFDAEDTVGISHDQLVTEVDALVRESSLSPRAKVLQIGDLGLASMLRNLVLAWRIAGSLHVHLAGEELPSAPGLICMASASALHAWPREDYASAACLVFSDGPLSALAPSRVAATSRRVLYCAGLPALLGTGPQKVRAVEHDGELRLALPIGRDALLRNRLGQPAPSGTRGRLFTRPRDVLIDTGLFGVRHGSTVLIEHDDCPAWVWRLGRRMFLPDIERALRALDRIEDCVVRVRRSGVGECLLVAYVVHAPFVAIEALTGLATQSLRDRMPDVLVSLGSIPRRADGAVDEVALLAQPILDTPLLRQWEELAGRTDGVKDAAVLVDRPAPVSALLHWSDLCPAGIKLAADSSDNTAPAAARHQALGGSARPAHSSGPALPEQQSTAAVLTELLTAASEDETKGIVYLDAQAVERRETYRTVLEQAARIRNGLAAAGMQPGDILIYQFSDNRDFLHAFWACLWGGYVPVPLESAPDYAQPSVKRDKLLNVWQALDRPRVITDRARVEQIRSIPTPSGAIEALAIESLREHAPAFVPHRAQPDDLALLLLTSGSTGAPKAVMQTHRSLLARCRATAAAFELGDTDVSFNWMPMDHVGGIVMFHLLDVFLRSHQIHAATAAVLEEPLRWIEWLARYRATVTWAPNFAYALLNERLSQGVPTGIDLSAVRCMINAGEVVVAPTCRRFLSLLAPLGLAANAVRPSWGMSETCSAVTSSHRFTLASTSDNDAFVSNGRPFANCEMRIVDAQDRLMAEASVGRIQVRGSMVTCGYYRNPAATAAAFTADGWFITGDLGYLLDGELYITGREKDTIIVNGANYYPHEIEAVVERVTGVRVASVVACALRRAGSQTDELTVFFSPSSGEEAVPLAKLVPAIRAAIVEQVGLSPRQVIPLAFEQIPRTSIGKIQRSALVRQLEAGAFEAALKRLDLELQTVNTLRECFFARQWRASELPGEAGAALVRGVLIFDDATGIAAGLRDRVGERLGAPVVLVRAAGEFKRYDELHYDVDPRCDGDYVRLWEAIRDDEIEIDEIVHLWTAGAEQAVRDIEQLRAAQQIGALSVLRLVRSLRQVQGEQRTMRLRVVSTRSQDVSGNGQFSVAHGTLFGLLQTVRLELPWLQVGHIDLDEGTPCELLMAEVGMRQVDAEVAYRHGVRLKPALRRVDFTSNRSDVSAIVRGGTYVVVGGLGGIGAHVVEMLLTQFDASVLIVGRTNLSVDSATERATTYQRLLAQSAGRLIYACVDIREPEALERAVAAAERQWGRALTGIFDLANEGSVERQWSAADRHRIATQTTESFEAQFSTKVYGSWNLAQLLQRRPRAQLVSFSSVNGLFGGNLLGAYSAACSFQHRLSWALRTAEGRDSYCILWTVWQNIGMANAMPEFAAHASRALGYRALSARQGLWSLLGVLRKAPGEWVVGLDPASPALRPRLFLKERADRVALYVAADGIDPPPVPQAFQDRVGAKVDVQIIRVARVPRHEDGTLDRKALQAEEGGRKEVISAEPRNDRERQLLQIWRAVLGRDALGIQDNFFDLGGDSILAIQVIARANRLGWRLSTRSMFEHQTIASLADAAQDSQPEPTTRSAHVGEVPLAPVQHWFLEQRFRKPDHWNQSVLLESSGRLDEQAVRIALDALVAHHDTLRLRVTIGPQPRAVIDGSVVHVPFERIEITDGPVATSESLQLEATRVQSGLDLQSGRVIRAAWFDFGADHPGYLLLAVHHLVVDGVSWRILIEDFLSAYEQARQGRPIELPPSTAAYAEWSGALRELAHSAEFRSQAQFWIGLPRDGYIDLGSSADGPGQVGRETVRSFTLSAEKTAAVLKHPARVGDVLLTALALALRECRGAGPVLLTMEGHGRGGAGDALDLSLTVGWFTTIYPLALEIPAQANAAQSLVAVKQQMERVPGQGLSFGVMRYLSDDEALRDALAALPQPRISFNYLGQFDASLAGQARFRFADVPAGRMQDAGEKRVHELEIVAYVVDGSMRFNWSFDTAAGIENTVDSLVTAFASAVDQLLAHTDHQAVRSPADFPLVNLDEEQLRGLLQFASEQGAVVEQIWPATRTQQGLLFHSQRDPQSGVYLSQLINELHGAVDTRALRTAWQSAVDRNEIYRTCFHALDTSSPLQLILAQVPVSWSVIDWSALDLEQQSARWQALLRDDRARGFDPSRAPLMRITLVKLGAETFRMILTEHHAITDGWSRALILRDVFEHYSAAVERRPLSLPPRPSYAGYMSWLGKQSLVKAERYWSELLAGFDTPTSITPERGAPSEQETGAAGHFVDRKISGAIVQSLRRAVRTHSVTLSTALQGAWAVVLGRYADRREVVFGSTDSGRSPSLPGVHEMTGLFITNLPVRVSLEGSQELGAWLRQLQAQQLASSEHAYVSLREIQSWSDIAASQALFESVIVIENYPAADAGQTHGVRLAWADSVDQSHFPLMLVIESKHDALTLRMYFDRDRFARGHVMRLLEHCETVLESLSCDVERVQDLQMLTRWERDVLSSLNATRRSFDSHKCMQECLTKQARATPTALAVIAADRALTYAELCSEAVALSERLSAAGAARNELVAVLMDKGWEQVVAVYGVLYAGAAYLPIDPSWPHERQQAVVAASGAKLVVTTPRIGNIPEWARALPFVNVERLAAPAAAPIVPAPRQTPEDVAYVIFTSGSTGTPKGVTIRHAAAMNTLLDINDRFAVTSADRVLGLSSLTFDLSVYDIFGIVAAGGTLVMPSPEAVKDPQAWLELIERHGVTLWDSVPAMMQMLIDHVDEQRVSVDLPRAILLSGDWIPLRLPERIRAHSPQSKIVSLGGATEASIWSIAYEVEAIDPAWSSIPYGRPLSNQSFHVLDEQLRPCPIEVAGDLYIGGIGLAEGYWRDPERTARQFIVHPRSGERLYRTGDRGRVRATGYIEFLGRVDSQVKVHGYRVDLTEIENALAALPGIKAAVVAVKEAGEGGKHLVGYVVPSAGSAVEPERLRAELAARLPEYMVPWRYVAIDSVPLTANGKVDRNHLPEVGAEDRRTAQSHSNMTRDVLASIWADVLGTGDVLPEDNFFERGGHSLMVTQVMARIRRAFAVELPLRTLFDLPTLRQLADKVDAARTKATQLREPLRVIADHVVEASSAQQRSWFVEHMQAVTTTLNVATRLLLRGTLDLALLERCLRELVARHDSLRTVFEERDGVVMQVIAETAVLPLRVVELRDTQAFEDSTHEARRAFDLARGPLWKVSVYRLAPERHLLLVTFHHSVCDGWSLAVFMRELVQLYEFGSSGSQLALPPLPVQYRDFSEWQRAWLQSEECEDQLRYWRETLAGAAATATFPSNRPRPAQPTGLGADLQFDIEPHLVKLIGQLSKREAVTPYVMYLATLALLLSDQAEQTDVTIGATIANRRYAELEGVIGFFANQAAIRVQVEPQQTFLQFLAAARARVLSAYDNQDVPFERVVDATGHAGALSHTPLFQVKLVLQNTPVPIGNIAGLQAQPVDLNLGAAKFDLQITMEERAPALHVIMTYSIDLYEEAYIRSLVADYLVLLEAAIGAPDLTLAELSSRMREARKQRLRAMASAALGTVPIGGARIVRASHRNEAS